MSFRSKTRLDVKSQGGYDIVRGQVSETITNLIFDQIQAFVDVCCDSNLSTEMMTRILKEYSTRTGITGLKVRKTRRQTWISDFPLASGSVGDVEKVKTSEVVVQGRVVKVLDEIVFDDGSYAAYDGMGELTFAVYPDDSGDYNPRHLTEEETLVLRERGF